MGMVLVFYCWVTADRKGNSLKQNTFIAHRSVGHKSGLAQMGSPLKVSPGWNQGISWAEFFSGLSREESAFKLIQVVVKLSSLWLKGRRPLFACLLSVGRLSELKATYIPSHVSDFIFTPATMCQISLCFESLSLLLLLLARENALLLKGSPDWVRPTQTISVF